MKKKSRHSGCSTYETIWGIGILFIVFVEFFITKSLYIIFGFSDIQKFVKYVNYVRLENKYLSEESFRFFKYNKYFFKFKIL